MKQFIVGRVKSVKFAIKGALLLLKTEHAIISQVSVAVLMTCVGFLVGISKTEWIFQMLSFGMILTAEALNTAIEALCDFIHPNYHAKIGMIKDIAAGAVTFAALTALIVGVIIYFPYIFH